MKRTIQNMKAAIQRYNAEAKDIRKLIATNAEKYAPAVAEVENRRLYNQRSELANTARRAIEAAYTAEKSALADWQHYRGADVTDDIQLLSGAFDLNKQDISRLMVKHQGNYTMVQAISKYAREHNIPYIAPNPSEKLEYLDKYKTSAYAKIQRIENECGIDDFLVDQFGAIETTDADRAINGLTLENASVTMGNE